MAPVTQGNSLKQFDGQQFLNIETYRKSGKGVPTPVWFVQDGDRLYVRTPASSGKVKCVRNNPQVRVAPCDRGGGLKGEWVNADARLMDENESQRINGLLNHKYGFAKRAFDFVSGLRQVRYAVLAITLKGEQHG
jgi:PPOX class probable F420-dependent enzyme